MQAKGIIVLAAGGTGGHLFPAQALAEELNRRGYVIHLMTDERVRDYGKSFPAAETHVVPSATLSLSKPWLVPGRALRLYGGYRAGAQHPEAGEATGGRRLRRLSVVPADPCGVAARAFRPACMTRMR